MFKISRSTCIQALVWMTFVLSIGSALTSPASAQPDARIWETKQVDVLRSQYLDSKGMASHEVFLQAHGLYPLDQRVELRPYFTATFSKKDVAETDGQTAPRPSAKPLSRDFYVEQLRTHSAPRMAEPIWDGRVYEDKGKLVVGGYSSEFMERPVGIIDNAGGFVPEMDDEMAGSLPLLQISAEEIVFDPFEWRLLRVRSSDGQRIEERTRSFLPVTVLAEDGLPLDDVRFTMAASPNDSSLVLTARVEGKDLELGSCDLAASSIVSSQPGYRPELIEGCTQPGVGEVVTFTFRGEFSEAVDSTEGMLRIKRAAVQKASDTMTSAKQAITIDGQFGDWRNVRGVSDPEGDCVSYLYPNPDTDILEFKVANDDRYLYFYTRVAGAHGRTGPRGRYYWYAYIDVDADPATGYPPTRDDNCYFGVAIGDDSEAQFEFIGNRFIKTFFGFTGMGTEKEVLAGRVKLGPSHYAPVDGQGRQRDRYKVEYVNREGGRFITHDYTEGASEDIIMALSPDGSEVEMRVEFDGFLWDQAGQPLMYPGRMINLSVGAEAASDFYGSDKWGADSSPVIYGYEVE